MRNRLVSSGVICLLVAVAGAARADVLATWNGLALDTVRVERASDADAARLYAMVDVAIFDAVNAVVSRGPFGRDQALVSPSGAPFVVDFSATAAAAAHAVLSAVYPDQAARFDAQLDADLAALAGHPGVASGRAWGAKVGAAVVAARAADGSSPVESQPAGSGPGIFRAAWSGVQYRNLTPFAIADSGVFVGGPPPDLTSVEYAADLAAVKIIGNAAIPDPEALATFQYWALAAGTVQPPGEWLKIALEIAGARGLSFYEEARLLALLTMAEADTVAPTVMTKWLYRHWRPATAIREADTDGNPYTDPDPTWAPRAGGIGSSPQQWSGHSSFSAAAAGVLAGFFCRDDIAFTHVSDSSGGLARSYDSFSGAAAEAGRSRVLGGIHFEFGNRAGLEAGRGIAGEVLQKKLLRRLGPTHLGACPL